MVVRGERTAGLVLADCTFEGKTCNVAAGDEEAVQLGPRMMK